MKRSTREGVGMIDQKDDKEAITEEEEEKFWLAGQLGMSSSRSLLNSECIIIMGSCLVLGAGNIVI